MHVLPRLKPTTPSHPLPFPLSSRARDAQLFARRGPPEWSRPMVRLIFVHSAVQNRIFHVPSSLATSLNRAAPLRAALLRARTSDTQGEERGRKNIEVIKERGKDYVIADAPRFRRYSRTRSHSRRPFRANFLPGDSGGGDSTLNVRYLFS